MHRWPSPVPGGAGAAAPVVLQGHAIDNDGTTSRYHTSSEDYSPTKTTARSFEIIMRPREYTGASLVQGLVDNLVSNQGFYIEHNSDIGSNEGLRYVVGADVTSDRFIVVPQGNFFVLPQETWSHVVIVDTGTGAGSGVKFYVNGVDIPTAVFLTLSGDINTAGQKVNIGKNASGGSGFDGSIRTVRIYDKALSAAEVVESFNEFSRIDGSSLTFAGNLVHDWTVDGDDTIAAITDKAGSSDLSSVGVWSGVNDIKVYDGYDPAGLSLDVDVEDDASFVDNGTATSTAGVGLMALGNSGAAGNDDFCYLPKWTRAERVYVKADFKVTATPAAGHVMGIAFQPNESYDKICNQFLFNASSRVATIHTFKIDVLSGPPTRATSGALAAVSLNDELTMMVWVSNFHLQCVVINKTAGTLTTVRYKTTQSITGTPSSWDHPFSTSQLAVLTGTGTRDLTECKLYVVDPKDAQFVILSDSLGQGTAVTDYADTYASLFRTANEIRVVNCSGGGDRIASAEKTLGTGAEGEMTLLNPQGTFLVTLGANDNADTAENIAAAYTSLVSAIQGHGTYASGGAVGCLVSANNSFDATVKFHGAQTSSFDSTIDTYDNANKDSGSSNMEATSDSGDGTHWNSTGHSRNKDTLQTWYDAL